MKKSIKSLLVAMAFSVAVAPQAEAREIGAILQECGIGGAIFKTNKTAAAISNIIWDLGTTATISDLTTPETCKGGQAKVAMYIVKSYDKLETEVAKGNGKYLNTLAQLSGKSVSEIRTKFAKLVTSKDYEKMTKAQKAQKLFDITTL